MDEGERAPAAAMVPEIDRRGAERAVRALLQALGEDPDRAGLTRTPSRVVDAMSKSFAGVGVDPATAIPSLIPLGRETDTLELITLRDVPFRSLCEHHLIPFYGTADLLIAPRDHTAGFSRLAAVVSVASKRPQLQEDLGDRIVRAITARMNPLGVLVRLRAHHGCMEIDEPSGTSTSVETLSRWGDLPSTFDETEYSGLDSIDVDCALA